MSPRQRLLALAFLLAVAFAVLYDVAFATNFGLRVDRSIFLRVSGIGGLSVQHAGSRALDTLDVGSMVAFAALTTVIAVARRRASLAVGAVVLLGGAAASAELLKHVLARVAATSAAVARGEWLTSFPSGHATVAASLALVLVIVVPQAARPALAVAGAAYAAVVGTSLVALGWHLPSDVVGGYLLAAIWAALVAAALVRRVAEPPGRTAPAALAAAAMFAVLAVGAALALGRHPQAAATLQFAPSLVASGLALGVVSLALFGVLTLAMRPQT